MLAPYFESCRRFSYSSSRALFLVLDDFISLKQGHPPNQGTSYQLLTAADCLPVDRYCSTTIAAVDLPTHAREDGARDHVQLSQQQHVIT